MKNAIEMRKRVRRHLASALVKARKGQCRDAKQFLHNAQALVRDSEYLAAGFRNAGDRLRPKVKAVAAKVSRACAR